MHDMNYVLPNNMVHEVLKDVSLYRTSKGFSAKLHPLSKVSKIIFWCSPSSGLVCLNTDGVIHTGYIANWLRGFQKHIGICNSNLPEF